MSAQPRSCTAFPICALLPFFLFFCLSAAVNNGNFTLVNGQIFTPGLSILDAPQPYTPLGGDFLQVAIDISGNGQLQQPPNNADPFTQIFNITLFLTSYERNRNFTISDATGPVPPLTDILTQETSSTVKHVNWLWPLCLVGNGQPTNATDARGNYNISIHESSRINGTFFYTIVDLPVQITNSIPMNPSVGQGGNPRPGPQNGFGGRVSCAQVENPVVAFDVRQQSVNEPTLQPFIEGAIQVQTTQAQGSTPQNIAATSVGSWKPTLFLALSVSLTAVSVSL